MRWGQTVRFSNEAVPLVAPEDELSVSSGALVVTTDWTTPCALVTVVVTVPLGLSTVVVVVPLLEPPPPPPPPPPDLDAGAAPEASFELATVVAAEAVCTGLMAVVAVVLPLMATTLLISGSLMVDASIPAVS